MTFRALLATYLGPRWRLVALLGVVLLASIGLQLANPQVLRLFIDSALTGADPAHLVRIGLLFLLLAAAIQAVTVAETYLADTVGLSATNTLRADLTLHCLRLDPRALHAFTPGELIERIDGDVGLLARFCGQFVVTVLGNVALLVGLLVALALIDWRIAAALGVFAAGGLAAMERLRALALPRWSRARQASADLFGFLEERLLATEDIRSSGATRHVLRQFLERSRALVRHEVVAGTIGVTALQSGTVLVGLGGAVALGMGVWLYLSGAITLGSVYVIFAYALLMHQPLEQISRQLQNLQQAAAGLGRVRQLLGVPEAWTDGTAELPAGPLTLALEHVTFGYSADEPVLRDLSLQLAPGESLGVLGRTGIGKSTLARLVLRLYDPDAGSIRLAGRDVRHVRRSALRSRVGLVTQDVQLFHATVRDNLSLFDPSIPDARIVAALEQLGLVDWLAGLPNGLDTLLAPHGSGLSAGEAQLLAFARVFLRDPGLLILDEASARLDPATERRIETAIERLLVGRTAIIIAHRLATVERVDRVLILDAHGIRESGPRARLASDPSSALAALLRTGNQELLA